MNMSAHLIRPLLRAAAATLVAGFVVLKAEESPATKEQPAKAAASEVKNNFLFMGANLQVVYKGKAYLVQELHEDFFVISVDNKKLRVKPASRDVLLKRSFKLGDRAIRVEKLLARQGYRTVDGNKLKRGGIAMTTVSAEEGMQYASQAMMQDTDVMMGLAQSENYDELYLPESSIDLPDSGTGTPASAAGYAKFLGIHDDQARGAGADAFLFPEKPEPFSVDALGIVCQITSVVPLKKPFAVVVMHYVTRDQPDLDKTVFLTKELPEIGQKPYLFELNQGGFPQGFLSKGVEMHVYDHGRELASNVASKVVALSDADAHSFLVIDFIGRSKGVSVAPKAIMKKYTASVLKALTEERYAKPLFVKVNKAGLVVGVYADKECTQKANPELETVLNRWRFLPALDKGVAVEGVAQVRISDTSL